ncbi:MAG: protein kinase [Planctomycetota bacterium]
MNSDSDHELRLMAAVNEYTERAQFGDSPSIEEYCERHPDLAEELRDLLGVLDVMEDLRPSTGDRQLEVDSDVPDQIGDYRIIGEIGRGGMGVVYEAEQISLGRRVALKVLPQRQLHATNARVRFQREARAAAKMHHTNIVPVFEVGEKDGHFFYAMQLIDGRSLDEIIAEFLKTGHAPSHSELSNLSRVLALSNDSGSSSNASVRQTPVSSTSGSHNGAFYRGVAHVGQQTAEALAYAHHRNVVHRDVKPSNLLLDKHGSTWVTDFGLAKLLEAEEQLTNTGDHLGTLRYMSPERFRGRCDERADIYSLGVTLYEMATKRPAFESADRAKLTYLISNTDPRNPRSIDPSIPRDLETIILKAIQKEPAERFSSAEEMAGELTRFLNDEPIRSRRTTLIEQSLRWARRNRALAASLVSVASLLLLLGIAGPVIAFRQAELRLRAEQAVTRAESAEVIAINKSRVAVTASREARSAELEAQNQRLVAEEALRQQRLAQRDANRQRAKYVRNLYFSEMNRAGALLQEARGVLRVREILDRWRGDPQVADLQGWEWSFLEGAVSGQAYRLERSDGAKAVEWSPDGSKIAFPSWSLSSDNKTRRWTIRIEDAESGKLVGKVDGHPVPISEIRWHPNEAQLVSIGYDRIVRIWDIDAFQQLREFGPYSRGVGTGAWSPTGDRLVWSVDGEGVILLDATTEGSQPELLPDSPTFVRSLQFSPDGTHLASGVWFNHEVNVYSIQERINAGEFTPRVNKPCTAIIWRDGHRVAYLLHTTPSGRIDLYRPDGELMRSYYGHTRWAVAIDVMRDGSGFISGGRDGNVFVWDIRQGRPHKQIVEHTSEISVVKVSNDNRFAASVSNDSIQLWDTQSQHTRLDLFDPEVGIVARQRRVTGLSWEPTGARLAASGFESMGRVWDPVNREVLHKTGTHGPAWFAAWHPTLPTIAFGGGGLMFMDSQSGAVKKTEMNAQFLKWNADGTRFARMLPENGHRIYVHSFPDLEVLAEFPCEPEAFAWHPRVADRLALINAKNRHLVIVEGTEVRVEMIAPPVISRAMDWSPDGSKLAIGYDDDRVRVWEVESGQLLNVELRHSNPVNAVAWNADGSRLASGSTDGTLRLWETSEWHQTITHRTSGTGVTALAWSPDSSKIAVGDEGGFITIWFPGASMFAASEANESPQRLGNHRHYLQRRFQAILNKPHAVAKDSGSAPESVEPMLVRSEVARRLVSEQWCWNDSVRLSEGINTEHNEDAPFVTADGLQLYFNSDRPDGSGGYDLYVSRRETVEDDWGPPLNLGESINSPGNDQAAFVTADGLSLFFCSDRDGVYDLYEARRRSSGEEWGMPRPLPPPINSSSVDLEPTLSSDGLTLLFCSGREPKHQVCDMMIARRESLKDDWSPPKNLGPWLNSAEWQGSPKLMGDEIGSTLIFHSADGPRISSRTGAAGTFATHEPLPSGDVIYGAFSLFLWKDGRTLYFRRTDTETETHDLWFSIRQRKETIPTR